MLSTIARTSSFAALVAAAGLAVAGTGAMAADLGGNCCADLEERVAELEATAARKGNRKVSLQIYGQVSEAIVFWNDGGEKNTYVVEDYLNKNRLGFQGNAKINSDWSAGYRIELGIRAYRSSSVNQLALGASTGVPIPAYNTQSVALRQAHWYLDSKTYGRISVGRDNDAVNGVASINLGNPGGFSGLSGPGYINNSFFLRVKGRPAGNAGLSNLTWGDTANFRNGDGPASMAYSETGSGIHYTSPFFLGQSKSTGFRLASSWGMDDFWSVALRYAETFGAIRVAGGIGYSQWSGADRGMCSSGAVNSIASVSNVDCNSTSGSLSIMHVPTGLYVTGQAGQIVDKNSAAALTAASTGLAPGVTRPGTDGTSSVWAVQVGWQAKLNTLGNTTFWAQRVQYDTGLGVRNSVVQPIAAGELINSLGAAAVISGSQTTYWGGGISQEITAAAMTLYAGYHVGSTDIMLRTASAVAPVQTRKAREVEDFATFYTGAMIRF